MNTNPERILLSAMRYIAAYYGGTLAHHILAIALKQVKEEKNVPYEN